MKKYLLPGLIVGFLGLFLVFPLFSLLQGAFFIETEHSGLISHRFSLQYFALIFANPFYRDCLLNSFAIGFWTTCGTLLFAFPIAYLFERVDFPAKPVFGTLFLVPLILPPFVGAIGLKQLLARFGSLNLLLSHLGLTDIHHPIDWLGQAGASGIVVLEVLHLFPILFLGLQATLANIDPSLREAGRNLGSTGWDLFRRVSLPLAMPGLYASGSIVFVSAFTDLGVPLIFNYTATVPTQIYNLVTQTNNPMGHALVVLTLLFVSVLFLLGRVWGEGQAMLARSSVYEPKVALRGLSVWIVTGSMGLWFFLSILPHLGVILQSVSGYWFFSILPSTWTFAHYHEVCSLPLTLSSLQNSLWYSGLSTLLDLLLGSLIAYWLARESFLGKGVLEALSMMPLALPGLVSAFAYFVAFSRGPFPASMTGLNQFWLECFDPRQNPSFILVIAYAMHRLPYMVRYAYAGLQQSSISLEEASRNLGAGFVRTMIRITLPLLGAHLVAGAILTFSFSMLDVSNGLILTQETRYYPITKAILTILNRILPTAPYQACALGVIGMAFLGSTLWISNRLFGHKSGTVFRA